MKLILQRALALIAVLTAAQPFAAPAPAELEFFEKRIRPLLADHCYKCHSAESEKLKGGLRLDTKSGLLQGGETGPALIPGDPDSSLLIKAVRWESEKLQMPPKTKLSPAQIADLEAWVRLGAPDPRSDAPAPATSEIQEKARHHWAFQAPKAAPVPAVKNESWAKTSLDRFILAKLEATGLAPAPAADRRSLLRRVSYDLTGLPPTIEQVEEFERDHSPGAYDRFVSRLLDSPRYGERWARHWLDVARFADTKGYVYTDREESRFVHSHVYRDWVIHAFNTDLPYNEFLLQQIAGDQYPRAEGPASPQAATGFLTVGRRFLGVTHDIIDDRIDVLAKATQALTVSCARCHDHKFDPIPIGDYYSLYGVFNGSTERTVSLENHPRATKEYEEFKQGHDERVGKLQASFEKRKSELLAKVRLKTPEYLLAVLEADQLPTDDHYEIRGPDDLNPTIARQWQAYLFQAAKEFHPVWSPWTEFAKLPKPLFAEKSPAVWEELKRARGSELNSLVRESFEAKLPSSMEAVARRYGELLSAVHQKQLASQIISAGEKPLAAILDGPESPITVPAGSVWDIEWFFHEGARVEFGKLQSEIDRWIIQSPGSPRFSVLLEDKPVQRNPRVFRRGNPASKGDEVPRQYLSLIEGSRRQPFAQGSGRLELARAIASPDNPLTARVMVNRVWAHHFGEGLVESVNDFGLRSQPPSHPELLDWLARYFVENGWSVKKLQRLILASNAYQQSSAAENPQAELKDPENRLLWRMNRRRLDFEELRDSLLRASGELAEKTGGKPVPLYAGPLAPVRSIYGYVDRQFLPGVYRVFDFPNPDLPSGPRSLTTVPQQALYLMNSPFLVERARSLAGRTAPASSLNSSPDARVAALYRAALQRDPTPPELELSRGFIAAAEAIPAPEPPPPPPPSDWSYGFAQWLAAERGLTNFTPLPYFSGSAWQGGPDWPDAALGWARLTAEGGHAGNDLQHAAVRRWTSPIDGHISITATLEHKPAAGDGIHAALVSSRHGILGEWNLLTLSAKTDFDRIPVKKGDTFDFAVDIRGGLNNDEFLWAPAIKWLADTATAAGQKAEWNAKTEFNGPAPAPPVPLQPWESLAQALLLSNEFVFVD